MNASGQDKDVVGGSGRSTNRLLLTPASNILAHVGRCVMLARELKSRGHSVVLAGTDKFLNDPSVIQPGEFSIYPLEDFDAGEGLEILRKVRKTPSKQILDKHIQAELSMLDQVRPDVVINDFRLTLYISARLRRIPIISLVGGRWIYQYAAKPFRAPRTHPLYPVLKRVLGETGTDKVLPRFQRWIIRYKMRPFGELSRKYGVERKKDLWDLLVGDDNLILDTELMGPTNHLPKNFCRVGPIFWTPDIPLPDWIGSVDRSRPVIYLTLGSTGHAELFRRMTEILGDSEYSVIMSTGGQFENPPGRLPSNFYVAKFLPGEQVMNLADIVVFHGGAGTGYQAMAAGKPSVVIATHLEQEFVAEVLEEQGAGVFLTMNEVLANPSVVRKSIETMVEHIEFYRSNMERMRDNLRQYQPVKMAADRIEGFMGVRP